MVIDPNRRRAIGYIRVSTAEQAENGMSLEAQRDKIEQYCNLHDMQLIGLREDVYTGKTAERDGINDIMDMARNGEIDHVVFWKLDRFGRRLIDLLNMSQQLHDMGVAIHSVVENLDTESAQGNLYFQLLGSFAEFERRLISERTRNTMALKRKKKERISRHSPLGARFVFAKEVGDKPMIIPHEGELNAIRMACELRDQNLSFSEISKELEKRGLVSPRSGNAYSKSTIFKMLKMRVF
jgi:DNA invertase Pin-like site-specific DNA recombinase